MDDIFEQARNSINPGLIRELFCRGESYSRQGQFYTLSPLRHDSSVGSFYINEDNGLYYDYATEDGGDFIELVSKSFDLSLTDAAKKIIQGSGVVLKTYEKPLKTSNKKAAIKPMLPIPKDKEIVEKLIFRITDEWCVKNWGNYETINPFKNTDNEGQFVTVRFVKKGTNKNKKRVKNDILFYYGQDGNWYPKWHEDLKPFPPYKIENTKESDLPVLIVEGEKCANVKVEGYNVVSWLGGTSNVNKTNWSHLKWKDVIIWPDADSEMDRNKTDYLPREIQPGMKAAYYLKSQLPKARILEIYRAKPIKENPKGWDLADLVNEGGDPVEFINQYLPHRMPTPEIDPYQVYRSFVDNFYDADSLDQQGGHYWQYIKEDHYWDKILRTDINNNFQRWLEETGLQWIISKKQKATTFINDTKQYLDRHSLGYSKLNPFKEAAIAPYIHLKNGAVHITKNSIDWIDREKYGEDTFKKLYPVNCLEFTFDFKNYKDIEVKKDCPGFYFFCKEMIPRNYLEKLNDNEKQKAIDDTIRFISQIFAYALSPIKPNEYCFGIYGPQRTGKSFLIKILKSLVGEKFCVERRISDMENNRFGTSGLWGKKIFIEPDLKTRKPLPEDFIKDMAGEQTLTIEEKNMAPLDGVKTSLAMFFVSNYEFKAKGVEGLARRMILVPYKNKIKNHDTKLLDKIMGEVPHGTESGELEGDIFDERPSIFALAMQGWGSFCNNNYEITPPVWAQVEKDNWIIQSNGVLTFLVEEYFSKNEDFTISKKELYETYKTFCENEEKKPLGKINFYEEVKRDDRVTELRLGNIYSFIIKGSDKSKVDSLKEQHGIKDDIPW